MLDASMQMTFLSNEERKMSPSYAAAEVLWYFSGEASIEMPKFYAPSYERFGDENGEAHGAYGPRVGPQVQQVVQLLKNAVRSRQSVIALWTNKDLELAVTENTVKDLPCTLSWQFLVRKKALHMIVTMRSNDIWLGMPYDVFAFTCYQRVLAGELGVGVGEYHHQVGSLHLYKKHIDRANAAMRWPRWKRIAKGHEWKLDDTLEMMQRAVAAEREMRTGGSMWLTHTEKLGTMARDLVLACAMKSCPGAANPKSELLCPRS